MTESATPPAGGKGLAVASLVCGILLCIPGVTGLAAIVLGVLSLKKGQAGKGLAIAGIVLGTLGLLLIPLWVKAYKGASMVAELVPCTTGLTQIGAALKGYETQKGKSPTDLAELAAGSSMPLPAAGHCAIVLLPFRTPPADGSLIRAHCQGHTMLGQKVVLCLLSDGTVKALPEAEFRNALVRSEAAASGRAP